MCCSSLAPPQRAERAAHLGRLLLSLVLQRAGEARSARVSAVLVAPRERASGCDPQPQRRVGARALGRAFSAVALRLRFAASRTSDDQSSPFFPFLPPFLGGIAPRPARLAPPQRPERRAVRLGVDRQLWTVGRGAPEQLRSGTRSRGGQATRLGTAGPQVQPYRQVARRLTTLPAKTQRVPPPDVHAPDETTLSARGRATMRESLRAALRQLGISLRDDWLAACDAHLRAAHPGFDALPHDRQARCAPLFSAQMRARSHAVGCALTRRTAPGGARVRAVPAVRPQHRGRRHAARRGGARRQRGRA